MLFSVNVKLFFEFFVMREKGNYFYVKRYTSSETQGLLAGAMQLIFLGESLLQENTRAKRLRMPKVSIFKLAVANANFTTRMPVFELKSNFNSIQNFKAGNVKPPGMHWSKDF